MKVLEPIETAGMTAADVDDLSQRVREVMLREVIALSQAEGTGLKNKENGGAVASGVDAGKTSNAL